MVKLVHQTIDNCFQRTSTKGICTLQKRRQNCNDCMFMAYNKNYIVASILSCYISWHITAMFKAHFTNIEVWSQFWIDMQNGTNLDLEETCVLNICEDNTTSPSSSSIIYGFDFNSYIYQFAMTWSIQDNSTAAG